MPPSRSQTPWEVGNIPSVSTACTPPQTQRPPRSAGICTHSRTSTSIRATSPSARRAMNKTASVAFSIRRRCRPASGGISSQPTAPSSPAASGYKNFETRNVYDENGVLIEPHSTDNQAIGRGTLDFEQKLTGTTTLINKFLVEAGSANTFFQNDLGLQVKMKCLSLAVGYSLRHSAAPPMGFKKTDTLSTLNLVYEIK